MVRFYDPIDTADLKRIVKVLRSGGIEYFLQDEPVAGLGGSQILIAEEDVAEAEQLLASSLH